MTETTAPLTPPELAALAEMERKATPGPWKWTCDGHSAAPHDLDSQCSDIEEGRMSLRAEKDRDIVLNEWAAYADDAGLAVSDSDAALIAAARNALPRLLATIAERERERDEARAQVRAALKINKEDRIAADNEIESYRAQLASVQSSADETAAAPWKAQAECESLREKADAIDRIAEIIDRREWPRAGHSVACAFGEIVAIRRALSAAKAKDATTEGVATRSEGAASSDRTRKEAK